MTGLVLLGRAWVDVTGGDVTGVVLRIGDPLRIHGTIGMEGQDKPDLSGVRIQLRLLDSLLANVTRATLGAENTFTLTNVSPARHAILVSGLPENAYVKSIRLGSRETIDTGLDLSDMQAVPPLEIRISPNGATIQGTVDWDDDKPAPKAWVAWSAIRWGRSRRSGLSPRLQGTMAGFSSREWLRGSTGSTPLNSR